MTGKDGTGLTVSNGQLQASTASPGVRVYKAVAALPSGERMERPFVVRVIEPVTIDEFRYTHGNLTATITNNGPERGDCNRVAASIRLEVRAGATNLDRRISNLLHQHECRLSQ